MRLKNSKQMRRIGHTMEDNMTTFRIIVLLTPILTACASNSVAENSIPTQAKTEQMGWLHGNCLAIKDSHIPIHSKLSIILLDEAQSVSTAEVLGPATSGEQCYPLLEDRRTVNVGAGYSFYLVNTKAQINLAIGSVGKEIDTHRYNYSYCTTSEGVQFSTSEGSKTIWSGYYYLGYDSESTCPEQT